MDSRMKAPSQSASSAVILMKDLNAFGEPGVPPAEQLQKLFTKNRARLSQAGPLIRR